MLTLQRPPSSNTIQHINPTHFINDIKRLPLPALPGRHPKVRALRAVAEKYIRVFQKFAILELGVPEMNMSNNGYQLVTPEEWKENLQLLTRPLKSLQDPRWLRFEHDLARYFPTIAKTHREERGRMIESIRQFSITLCHFLGMDPSPDLGEAIDFSIPMFDPPPQGPSVKLDL